MEFDRDTTALFDTLPSFLEVGGMMLKATPQTEGGHRFIYIEASNEMKDQQNEIVLAKALADSADYYLKFGNLDIDHYTQIGAKRGIPNYESFEIGRPVAVRIENDATFVKGEIFAGEGPAAERANQFWSSITDISPPQRWYPSVGGAVTGKGVAVDDLTKSKVGVITAVRWTNIGFSKTPVNANLPTVSTSAFGPLAKSWGAMFKGLEAGGGSDVATLTGGAAMRVQSLDRQVMSYTDFRDQFANVVRSGEVKEMSQSGFVRAAKERFDLPAAHAAKYVEQFLTDLKAALKEKR
ncbi:hypothetical protein LXA47_19380 [Massilia sp. P8910]|uniref:hypothetical protein n=1 Tax=Massilia antarctica TaxID=2765360 RepID=UPI001E543967|nr:hypothetical protein [Massilia antarctica]MCE3605750.1 hypothetical protein [Massilia antarctica]